MKKIIVALFVAVTAIVANAEYLYWGIDGESGNYGKLKYFTSQDFLGNSTSSFSAYKSEAQEVDQTFSTSYYGPSIQSSEYTYYYVETYNYSDRTQALSTSDAYTYSYLASQGVIMSDSLRAQMAVASQVMTNAGIKATPEPTSGLLMLMGFAMLGLKRKKEV